MTAQTPSGRRILPWHAASHFNRGALLPAEAHDRAVVDIIAIEAESRAQTLDALEAAVRALPGHMDPKGTFGSDAADAYWRPSVSLDAVLQAITDLRERSE